MSYPHALFGGAAKRPRLLVFIAILLGTGGCSDSDGGGINIIHDEMVLGSGVPAQEDRLVSGFSSVSLAAVGNLYIQIGAQEALRVEAEDNLLPHLETFVSSGVLHIRHEDGFDLRATMDIEFHLTVTSLDRIVHTGVGHVEALNLSQSDLSVLLSGVGDLELAGTVTTLDATVTGVGDCEAENLTTVDAAVTITGMGSATVRASGTLEVTITGMGSVYYYGNPALTVHGSGHVVHMGP